ncbi:MAG: transporter related protein, partial [Pseudonocardia sp.]|nr:transporter related protein [Pseudonocardia sp.]
MSSRSMERSPLAVSDAPAGDASHTMEVRDLHKSFGDFHVLNGLNLQFQDDAITTILGPSGTGKSVLIKHLVGLLEPDEG